MWKAGLDKNVMVEDNTDDDWETDPDFINDVTEQEQRWGSSTIEGSGRTAGAINMSQLRKETEEADAQKKKKQIADDPSYNPAFGYGGKFGVERDRMDQSAVGHEYVAKVEKHGSQTDHSAGFGGKFGVQTDRVDKSAMSWDHKEKLQKHGSQTDHSAGFGGKFGVQTDRQDKSAVGWDHVAKLEQHDSQRDHSKGFGGKFGVQSDRQDKSAVGWDHHEAPQRHESQAGANAEGLSGALSVQADRVDKVDKVGTNYERVKPDIAGAKPGDLRARFENMGAAGEARTAATAPKRSMHAKAALFAQQAQPDVVQRAVQVRPIDGAKTAFLTRQDAPDLGAGAASVPKQLNPEKISQFSQLDGERERVQERETVPKAFDSARTEFLTQKKKVDTFYQQQELPQENNVNKSIDSMSVIKTIDSMPVIKTHLQQEIYETSEVIESGSKMSVIKSEPEDEIYQNTEVIETSSKILVGKAEPLDQIYQNTEDIRQQTREEYEESLYQNLEDMKPEDEIIDTGIVAVALYDYQAAADDEVSFDPDDVITHIEKIDEGWWRGMCKGKYGLFPANYVQITL